MPPGAEGLATLISTPDLAVEETWQPQPGKAKTGDAFTRTVTISASDVPGMAFPPFPTGQIDGLGVYFKAPEMSDRSEREELRGQRRQSITYVCERPGRFVIPAIRLTWWSLAEQRLRTNDFPERVLEVAPNPVVAVSSTVQESVAAKTAALVAAALVLIASIVVRYRRLWWPVLAMWRPVYLAPLNPGAASAVSSANDSMRQRTAHFSPVKRSVAALRGFLRRR
jgi:hypothetical protein